MRNKKILGALLAVTTLATFGLAGCGNSGSNGAASKEDDKTITVAASPTPHAEILNKAVKPLVEKDGYKLVVKEFTDYVQPNTATEDGEVDANYFQHKPYLDNFNKEKGTHLVSVEGIHFEPFGLYPGKTKELKDLQDGATVAVPNDATNEARALLLLQDAGGFLGHRQAGRHLVVDHQVDLRQVGQQRRRVAVFQLDPRLAHYLVGTHVEADAVTALDAAQVHGVVGAQLFERSAVGRHELDRYGIRRYLTTFDGSALDGHRARLHRFLGPGGRHQ